MCERKRTSDAAVATAARCAPSSPLIKSVAALFASSRRWLLPLPADIEAELKRIEEAFTPLVLESIRLKRALRIGTNHGSLSDRIMNRYGDTPLGMVESALEFAHIARKHSFHNFKFSMKSSNPKVMIECYRLLAARLALLGPDWN